MVFNDHSTLLITGLIAAIGFFVEYILIFFLLKRDYGMNIVKKNCSYMNYVLYLHYKPTRFFPTTGKIRIDSSNKVCFHDTEKKISRSMMYHLIVLTWR